jgi:hypothetical protein
MSQDLNHPNLETALKPEISAKIMGYIGHEKQHSRNFFRFLNLSRILAILSGMVISSLALSVFVWDGWLKFQLSNLVGLNTVEILSDLYFELILVVVVVVIVSLLIYRQTDWYFVKDMKWVLVGIALVLLITAGFISLDAMKEDKITSTSTTNTIPQIAQTIQQLPYHQSNPLWQKLEKQNLFLGKIESIDLKNKTVTASSVARVQSQTLLFKASNIGLKKFKLSQLVLISFEKNQDEYKANKIKPIDLQNRPKLKELLEQSDPIDTILLEETQKP